MKKWYILGLVSLILFIHSSIGSAGNCRFQTVNNLVFGNYNPFSKIDLRSNAQIVIVCDKGTSGVATLSSGQSGSFSKRFLKGSQDKLSYNVYTNYGLTTIWGDGTAGTGIISISQGIGTLVVYGAITANQDVAVGAYNDTLLVTLIF